MSKRMDLPQGTLNLLIHRTLSLGCRRRAKYYDLSKPGHRHLEVESDAWQKLTAAVAQVPGTV